MLVTLNFDGGALSFIVTALLIVYTHPWAAFWRASGSFSDQRKQNKAAVATLDIGPFCLALCPQPTWASILAAAFPLRLE